MKQNYSPYHISILEQTSFCEGTPLFANEQNERHAMVLHDLSVWQVFSQKWMKRTCRFKENSQPCLLTALSVDFVEKDKTWNARIQRCEAHSVLRFKECFSPDPRWPLTRVAWGYCIATLAKLRELLLPITMMWTSCKMTSRYKTPSKNAMDDECS